MGLTGIGTSAAAQAGQARINRVAAGRTAGSSLSIAQPLRDLLFLKVDDNWLAQHPNIAQDYDTTLTFTFFDTESGIQEQAQANYGSMEVIGRAESYKTFAGTSNKTVTMPFRFRAQGLDSVEDMAQAMEAEVTRPARFLDALQYPIEDPVSGISYAPPPVYMQIGSLLRLRAIVTDVAINWMQPFEPTTMMPMGAEVDVTFEVVRQTPVNYMTVGGPSDGKWQ